MDKFKKFLQQNRAELDTDVPRDFVWQNISRYSSKKKGSTTKLIRMAVAAAALALVILSVKWIMSDSTVPVIPVELVNKTEAPKREAGNTAPVVLPALEEKNTVQIGIAKLSRKKRTVTMYQLVNTLGRSYAEVVDLQLSSIRSTPMHVNEPGYFNVFKTELQQMDQIELSLRNLIKAKGPDDRLLEQLINIYQYKLDLLKTLRAEINKLNERAQQFQSPADSLTTYYLDI